MPVAAPRSCTVCGVAVVGGSARCDAHRARDGTFADRRRGSRHERGYGSEWDRIRLLVLERDAGLCRVCLDLGHVTLTNIVDHIVNKRAGGTDALSNLRCICKVHHDEKTAREARSSRVAVQTGAIAGAFFRVPGRPGGGQKSGGS